jgi:tartrate-resistant acid phosphatase type 5
MILFLVMLLPVVAKIAVVGDWGCPQCTSARMVAQSLRATKPDYVISVGDHFYPEGIQSTSDANVFSWIDMWTPSVPWYLILGNHDYYGNSQAQIDLTNTFTYWNMESRYYTEILDDIQIWFLDTTPLLDLDIFDFHDATSGTIIDTLYTQRIDAEMQYEWLQTSLQNSITSRKIFVGHHPLWTFGNVDNIGKTTFKPKILAFMQEYGVESYVSGHDHSLQDIQYGNLRQFIAGSGAFSYEFDKTPLLQEARLNFRSDEFGFLLVDGYNYTFYTTENRMLYTTNIYK